MLPSLHFPPDPARALALDLRMRQQLAQSLAHIGQSLENSGRSLPGALTTRIELLGRAGLASPSMFGLYYEATSTLLGNDVGPGLAMLDELAGEPLLEDRTLRILTFDQMPRNQQARYRRLMDTDPETPFSIVAPPPGLGAASVGAFAAALNRLRAAVPETVDEFEAIIREVILVSGDPAIGYDFAGGCCYMLWGALFINAGAHKSDVELMEAIAHESAHSLLFGFTVDEPLVLDAGTQRFASPLRDDLRPMDGIYHATFVSARMHWTMSRLLASGQLSASEADEASARMQTDARNFSAGYATLRAHAQLSATGRQLLDGALAYMEPCLAGPV